MSFWARLGLTLLAFGAFTLIAPAFGYAPRKLAEFSPAQLRVAGVVFMCLGGLCFTLGGSPKLRKNLLLASGIAAGACALMVVIALAVKGFGGPSRLSRSGPPPPPPPVSGPSASDSRVPNAAVASDASSMTSVHRARSEWRRSLGRERVWSVVVHLGGEEAPPAFESRLRSLFPGNADQHVVVARSGGIIEAALAPLDQADALRTALNELFPTARIQLMEPARQVVVFPN